MTNDDFLDGLSVEWKEREIELSSVRLRMEQREKEMRRAITVARLSIGLFIGGAAAFAWFAFAKEDVLAALGAVAFLTATPFQLVELRMRRRVMQTDYMEAGQSLLEHGLRHARARVRILRFARWVSGFFLLFALLAFGLAFLGLASKFQVAVIAGAWAVSGITCYILQHARLDEAKSEVTNYQAILADYQAEEEH